MSGPSASNSSNIAGDMISLPDAVQTGKTLFFSIYFILGVSLNLMLFVAICREPKLHKPSFFFLLNLSFVEIIRVALCVPFYVIVSTSSQKFSDHYHLCKSVSFFYTLLAYETILTLLIISLSRYSIIVHKEFYTKKLTTFVCLTVTAMTWTLAVIMAIPPIFRAGMPVDENSVYTSPAHFDSGQPYMAESQENLESYSGHQMSPGVDQPVTADQNVPVSLGCCHYYQITDGVGFTIVFNIVLVGVHLIHLRVFMFMRQHRKMNPTRRAPAISDNWTFFGPVAAAFMPTSMSSQLQSVVVQGVSFPSVNPTTSSAAVPGRIMQPQTHSYHPNPTSVAANATAINRLMIQRSANQPPQVINANARGWMSNPPIQAMPVAMPGRHPSAAPSNRGMSASTGVRVSDRDAIMSREAIDGYEVGEKFTKTTYLLTCCVTLLWCPYVVINFTSVVSTEPITDKAFLLATFSTFCQSLITPLACLVMIPPLGNLAADWMKAIKCQCRRNYLTRSTNGNVANRNTQTPLYENLSQMVCSAV